jgi:hypothetical protein
MARFVPINIQAAYFRTVCACPGRLLITFCLCHIRLDSYTLSLSTYCEPDYQLTRPQWGAAGGGSATYKEPIQAISRLNSKPSLKHACLPPAHPYSLPANVCHCIRPAHFNLPKVTLLTKSTANQAVERCYLSSHRSTETYR